MLLRLQVTLLLVSISSGRIDRQLTSAVNPEISSGLPIPKENRFIQPGSRPEKYATPATMASDVAQNPVRPRAIVSRDSI